MTLRQLALLATLVMAAFLHAGEWRTSGYQEFKIVDPTGRYVSDLGGKLWDMSTPTARLIRSQHFNAQASLGITGFFTDDGSSIVRSYRSYMNQNIIERIDAFSGLPIWQQFDSGPIAGMINGGTEFVTKGHPGDTTFVRSVETGAIIRQFPFRVEQAFDHYGYGRYADMTWHVFDLNDGTFLKQLLVDPWPPFEIYSMNRRYALMFGFGQAAWFDVLNSYCLSMPFPGKPIMASDDGKWILRASSTNLYLINTGNLEVTTLPAPTSFTDAIFTPDSKELVVTGEDGLQKYRISDMMLLSRAGIVQPQSTSVYDALSKRVYSVGGTLTTFNDATADIEDVFSVPGQRLQLLSLGDSRRTLATGYVNSPTSFKIILKDVLPGGTGGVIQIPVSQASDSDFALFNLAKQTLVQTGQKSVSLYSFSGQLLKSLSLPSAIRGIAITPDDKFCLLTLYTNETVIVNSNDLTEVRREPKAILSVSPNGKVLLSTDTYGRLQLKGLNDGRFICILENAGNAFTATKCDWTPDSTVVFAVVSGAAGAFNVAAWDARGTDSRPENLLWRSTTPEDQLVSVAISPDGRRLCTTSKYGEVWSRDNPVPSAKILTKAPPKKPH